MATELVHTLRLSGGDYSLGSTWESAIPSDLTSVSLLVFAHGGINGTLNDGNSITGETSGATGTIEMEVTTGQILITVLTGTFQSGEQIYETINTNYVTTSDAGDSPIIILNPYDDWTSGLDDRIGFDDRTCNSTNYIEINVPVAERHDGTKDVGFRFNYSTAWSGSMLNLGANDSIKIYGIAASADGIAGLRGIQGPSASNAIVDSCLIYNVTLIGFDNLGYGSAVWRNCIALDCDGNGFEPYAARTNELYNCTIKGCATGIVAVSDATISNNVSYNNTTDYTGTADASSTNNATSEATTSHAFVDVTGVTADDFVDAGNDNYNLSYTSQLHGAGSDIGITSDIIGKTYHSYSTTNYVPIGAFRGLSEFSALRDAGNYAGMSDFERSRYNGNEYSLMSTWVTNLPSDLTTVNEQHVLECYADWGTGLSDTGNITTIVSSALNNIIIYAPEGQRHNGFTNNGFFMDDPLSYSQTIESDVNFIEIRYISVTSIGTDGYGFDLSNADNSLIDSCLAFDLLSTGFRRLGYGSVCSNSLSINCAVIGIMAYPWRNNELRNNTVINCGDGFNVDHTTILTNNVSFLCTTDYEDSGDTFHASCTNNATSEATTSHAFVSITGVIAEDFTNPIMNNYTLSADSQLRGTGADLSSSFTNDINGSARPTGSAWDIGADHGATVVKHALRTVSGWTTNQTAMEAIYGVGNYYTLPSTWESNEGQDLVANDAIAQLVAYDDWATGCPSSYTTINAFTSDASHYVEFTVAEGNRHDGVLGTNSGFYLIHNSTNDERFRLLQGDVYIKYWDFLFEATSILPRAVEASASNGHDVFFLNCKIEALNSAMSTCFEVNYNSSYAINCVGKNLGTGGSVFTLGPTEVSIYNCNAIDSPVGIEGYIHATLAYTGAMVNCLTFSCTNADNGYVSNPLSLNNATDETGNTSPAYDIVNLTSADFLDSTNGDFRPSSGSQLREAGLDMPDNYSIDIIDTERS